jgi:uncharacterized protein (TIGR02599 family)
MNEVTKLIRKHTATARDKEAFTLVELLVACAVFAVMMVLMAVAINQMSSAIKVSSNKVEAFEGARDGMESVTRLLGSATLNTYWDYFISSGGSYVSLGTNTNTPAIYGRQSDLQFIINDQSQNANGGLLAKATTGTLTMVTHGIFFQSLQGYSTNTNSSFVNPPGTLNKCGFFVAFGNDPSEVNFSGGGAASIVNKPRFRLYQWIPSTDNTLGMNTTTGMLSNSTTKNPIWDRPSWYNESFPLAENIIAFVVRVPDTNNPAGAATATNYFWNSKTNWPSSTSIQPSQMNELPPFVDVTMVAVDETVANRLLVGGATNSPAAASQALAGVDITTLFTTASNYTNDLTKLEQGLTSKHVPYRVFSTTVQLPGSKWSP